MGIMLALMQFLLIAYICLIEVKRKSSVVFMWATLLIMFGVMHTFSVLMGKSEYSERTLNEASFFVIVFCIIYIITRYLLADFSKGMQNVFSYEIICDGRYEKVNGLICWIFCVAIAVLLWKFIAFSGGLSNTSWGVGREYTASLGYANSSQIIYTIYFAMSGLPLFLLMNKQRMKAIICVVFMVAMVIITRNRITVIPMLVSAIAFFIFKMKKVKLRHCLLAAVGAVTVIYLVYGLRVFRHYGTIQNFVQNASLKEVVDKINTFLVTDNGELGLRNDFYYFMDNDNKFEGFGEGASYVRMLLVYIPTRFSFGLKPSDFAITMGTACGGTDGYSTHPTLFGDCYANLGWLGVILGVFWALYAAFADKITIRFKDNLLRILSYCLFASMYVIMGRGSVYNSFFYIAYGVPLLCGIAILQKYLPKIRFVIWSKNT